MAREVEVSKMRRKQPWPFSIAFPRHARRETRQPERRRNARPRAGCCFSSARSLYSVRAEASISPQKKSIEPPADSRVSVLWCQFDMHAYFSTSVVVSHLDRGQTANPSHRVRDSSIVLQYTKQLNCHD
jgi:hypothetical protein